MVIHTYPVSIRFVHAVIPVTCYRCGTYRSTDFSTITLPLGAILSIREGVAISEAATLS
ncbi:MAG: hypothetical protein VKJ46_09200 [Leptolyngbyaceae bacterium]|nr:hypothetical protein [Leptolyngbyaceae bacterium]